MYDEVYREVCDYEILNKKMIVIFANYNCKRPRTTERILKET